MNVPRRRKFNNNDLARYPGLGRWNNDSFYFQNPYTKRQKSLGTKDFDKAKAIWVLAYAIAKKEHGERSEAELVSGLLRANTHKSRGENIHLCDFVRQWREDMLGYRIVDEKALFSPTKVVVKIKRSQGKPISERTQLEYGRQAIQIENNPDAAFPVKDVQVLAKLRRLLSGWVNTPTHYNHLKAVLGRVYDHAVLTGLVDRNPMRDIDKLPVPKREVLIPDDAYIAITDKLMVHQQNKREFDGEWRVKICDLLYMLSQQPVDIFSLQLPQIDLTATDFSDPDPANWKYGEIKLSRKKTKVDGVIEMDAELRGLIDWLMNFRMEQLKTRNNVLSMPESRHLLIYPAYFDRRSRWKAVKHRTVSEWWREACELSGYGGQYHLSDLRKRGLTDEFANQGKNDKGIHLTDKMSDFYVLTKPPKRSRNTLKSMRGS